jgi:predicted O-methyltransferase YrrM
VSTFLFRVRSFLSYWLNAVDEHSLHSPFFFDFYTRLVKDLRDHRKFAHIETLRDKLLRDKRKIYVEDLGSRAAVPPLRKISTIANTSLSQPRFSRLYFRIAEYFDARTIVELGTSLGMNALYLAEKSDTTVTTFEGSPAIAELASISFEFASKKNIRLIQGDIDHTLPAFLEGIRKIDLAFIDANHRYEPTMRYFGYLLKKVHEKSVIILDDIHHSPPMAAAWKAIRSNGLVYASADLFRCGIVFFDPSLNKQHVMLQV